MKGESMREITYREAIGEAYREEMKRDKMVVTFGEDLAEYGGAFAVTAGLLEEFGPDRVRTTPISEAAIMGNAIGSAMLGLRPVAEIMFDDFIFCAGDQVVNQLAKLRYMSAGQLKIPAVIRMAMGAGLSQAAQHAQCVMGMFMNVPGLKIVCPSTPYDVKGLLKSAIRDDSPVLFFEHLLLYDISGDVPESEYTVPIGKSDVKREGKDVTVVAVAQTVQLALEASEVLEKEGIDVEVVDPVTLVPLDMIPIVESIKKTGKVVIAYNGPKTNGAGAEIAARISEEAIEYLDSPVERVAELDCPIPFAPELENAVTPQLDDIIDAIKKVV